MSVLSDEQKWQLWDEVSHPSACLEAMILAYGNAVADAAIAADRAARAEPVGWQFFHEGRWVNGMETNNHRANTEAEGIPVRDVFAMPPAAPDGETSSLVNVPEPSPAMWTAGGQVIRQWRDKEISASVNDVAVLVFRAMLAAAPAPSQGNGGAA